MLRRERLFRKKKKPLAPASGFAAMDVAMERAATHRLFGPEQSKFKARRKKSRKRQGRFKK